MNFLYHYTSIDTLALILKNRSIRFNSLSKVDDKEECLMDDLGNLGNSVLVSCWTRDKLESIPLWKMYSSNFQGCRIALDENMFSQFQPEDDKFTVLNLHDNSNLLVISHDFLRDMKYVKSFSKRTLISEDKAYRLGVLGREKNIVWEFQKECRFYIHQFSNLKNLDDFYNSNIDLNESYKYDFYDLKVDETAINNIIVTLGPKCNYGHKIIVKTLLDKYTDNGIIELSSLTGKV